MYYQIYHKRKYTKHVRFRDYIGIVIANRKYPPFKRNSGIRMFKIIMPINVNVINIKGYKGHD